MKSTFLKIVRIALFVLILVAVLLYANGVFRFKYDDGIVSEETFRALPDNSVDVLTLGSSHAFEDINTGVLWDEWGMSSYVLAGSIQPLWNTYYYLKEALETQHPKVIVLEVYRTLETEEYIDHTRIIKNTFGMENSISKLEAKQVSSPQDEFIDYALEFPDYHSRYSSLTSEDFLPNKGVKDWEHWKGSGINFGSYQLQQNPDVASVTERLPMSEKTEKYLRAIIQLAKNEGIPLVFVCSPYPLTQDQQKVFNSVSDIADEENIPFLNYNLMLDEVGLDFTGANTDLADEGHLNQKGNAKLTRHFGRWLSEHYDLPDHRDDEAYYSWKISADNLRRQVYNHSIDETQSLKEWLDLVASGGDYTVGVSFGGDYQPSAIDSFSKPLGELGADLDSISSNCAMLLQRGSTLYNSNDSGDMWYGRLFSGMLTVEASPDPQFRLSYEVYAMYGSGITFFLYDDVTGKLIEAAHWQFSSLDEKTELEPMQ